MRAGDVRWGWLVRFGQAHVWVETLAVAKEQCPVFYVPGIRGGPSAAWGCSLELLCPLAVSRLGPPVLLFPSPIVSPQAVVTLVGFM